MTGMAAMQSQHNIRQRAVFQPCRQSKFTWNDSHRHWHNASVKAVLLDERQFALASASSPLKLSRPKEGWSEHILQDWWKATQAAVVAVGKRARKAFRAVEAIGLSGQMHGATLLDSSDKVIRPAILWNDARRQRMPAAEAAEPKVARDRRQYRHAGLHRAEASVGEETRAAGLSENSPRCCCPRTISGSGSPAIMPADMSDSSGTSLDGCRARAWSVGCSGATDVGRR